MEKKYNNEKRNINLFACRVPLKARPIAYAINREKKEKQKACASERGRAFNAGQTRNIKFY